MINTKPRSVFDIYAEATQIEMAEYISFIDQGLVSVQAANPNSDIVWLSGLGFAIKSEKS